MFNNTLLLFVSRCFFLMHILGGWLWFGSQHSFVSGCWFRSTTTVLYLMGATTIQLLLTKLPVSCFIVFHRFGEKVGCYFSCIVFFFFLLGISPPNALFHGIGLPGTEVLRRTKWLLWNTRFEKKTSVRATNITMKYLELIRSRWITVIMKWQLWTLWTMYILLG